MSEFKPTKLNYNFVSNEELIAEAKGRGLLNENEQFVRKDVIELLKEWDIEHADLFAADTITDEQKKTLELKDKYQDEYLKEKGYTFDQVLSTAELLDEMNKYIAEKIKSNEAGPAVPKQYQILDSKGVLVITINDKDLNMALTDPNLKQFKDEQGNILYFQAIEDDDDDDPEKYEFNGKEITKEKYHQLKRAGLIV
jgi:hypothetical protein